MISLCPSDGSGSGAETVSKTDTEGGAAESPSSRNLEPRNRSPGTRNPSNKPGPGPSGLSLGGGSRK
jgi:hypothetical protein